MQPHRPHPRPSPRSATARVRIGLADAGLRVALRMLEGPVLEEAELSAGVDAGPNDLIDDGAFG
jgi:hypothetical protein